jgi:hypothetical protein
VGETGEGTGGTVIIGGSIIENRSNVVSLLRNVFIFHSAERCLHPVFTPIFGEGGETLERLLRPD